jgi:CubicO group peptidase (beta-lactamase class C family)
MKSVMASMLLVTLLATAGSAVQADSSDERGRTPKPPDVSLHVAALEGNLEAVRQHIEAGSDLNERDIFGSSPLNTAAAFGRTEVALALIDAGADMDIRNNEGSTPLHTAAFLCRTEIVRAMLEEGADRYLRNYNGHMALDAVAAPFDDVKDAYYEIEEALAPLGLRLDYEYIEATRPKIAEMLRTDLEDLQAVEFAPLPGGDWEVSTPLEQGLDPMLVAELYLEAAELPTLYGLLVIKDAHLIAEDYFNEGGVGQKSNRQSVTKSYTSALVGIALDQGLLTSVDQRMMEFFPEFAGRIDDPRKELITIRDLLEMRAGYPWEEHEPPYFDSLFFSGDWHWLPHLADFPLTSEPGTEFKYSNLTSYLLGTIVARRCGRDLRSYAEENLLAPLGAEVGDWYKDADGYRLGSMGIFVTARDMAKFGLLYLNYGEYRGNRVLSADWVRQSLGTYSERIYGNRLGLYFRDVGYGYQWWSARVGDHSVEFAWGHGGQLIVLLHDLDMIVVTTANPLEEPNLAGPGGWKYEGGIIELMGKFIKALPVK